ncbi:MAG: hypothetical protein ACYTHM_07760 [Planctomycetota bacterium]|jgi:hypothetical protein
MSEPTEAAVAASPEYTPESSPEYSAPTTAEYAPATAPFESSLSESAFHP